MKPNTHLYPLSNGSQIYWLFDYGIVVGVLLHTGRKKHTQSLMFYFSTNKHTGIKAKNQMLIYQFGGQLLEKLTN